MEEEIDFNALKNYELICKQEKGDYGVVFKARHKKTNDIVAIKKIEGFPNDTEAQRTFREVILLKELNGHENIISLLNVINGNNDMDLYLVFEYMDTDLLTTIRANTKKIYYVPNFKSN